MGNPAAAAGATPTFQEQLDAQRAMMQQTQYENFQQTQFQQEKNKAEEASKAISDAVKSSHEMRNKLIDNIGR
jgi:hypothetical protein